MTVHRNESASSNAGQLGLASAQMPLDCRSELALPLGSGRGVCTTLERPTCGVRRGTTRPTAEPWIIATMEFFTIAFSTFLGAAVALAGERLTRARDSRLQEEAAINNLILDLAAKRTFLVAEDWVWADGEVNRVVDSVFNARSSI